MSEERVKPSEFEDGPIGENVSDGTKGDERTGMPWEEWEAAGSATIFVYRVPQIRGGAKMYFRVGPNQACCGIFPLNAWCETIEERENLHPVSLGSPPLAIQVEPGLVDVKAFFDAGTDTYGWICCKEHLAEAKTSLTLSAGQRVHLTVKFNIFMTMSRHSENEFFHIVEQSKSKINSKQNVVRALTVATGVATVALGSADGLGALGEMSSSSPSVVTMTRGAINAADVASAAADTTSAVLGGSAAGEFSFPVLVRPFNWLETDE